MGKALLLSLIALLGITLTNASEEDLLLMNGVKLSKSVKEAIEKRTGQKFKFQTLYHWKDSFVDSFSYSYMDSVSHGIIIKNIKEEEALKVFQLFYPGIERHGSYLYLTQRQLDKGKPHSVDVAIVSANHQFEAISRVGVKAIHYDLSAEKIAEQLRILDKKYHLKLVYIDKQQLEFFIQNTKLNWGELVDDVSALCPDILEEDYQSDKAAMANDYLKKGYLRLRWN